MRSDVKRLRRWLSWFLCLCLLLPLSSVRTAAQTTPKRVIVVNAEQPNLWTLEQAHYLLAQMHRRNLDLKAKSLEDLDPNEIAGLRFDVMRMLVEFGATFNQADLVSNRLLAANQTFNAERRQELMTERDGLRREGLQLTADIEELQTQKAGTDDKDEQARIDARIAAKNARLTRVDAEAKQLDTELGTLTAPSGQLKATEGGATFDPEKLPKSVFDDAFKAAAAKQIEKFNSEPRLNASLRLDNFLQMQYEIISKQLSLLRDELGPGERLVFLELPQTVNATHHESERKWAQSWWKIAGYTRRVPVATVTPTPMPPQHEREYQPITTVQDINSIAHGVGIRLPLGAPADPCPYAEPATFSYEGDDGSVVRFADGPTLKPGEDPSPSSIQVSMPETATRVRKVTVTLKGLRHPAPDDVDLLLVGPQGQNAIIMSDVGGDSLAEGLTITLDDGAASGLPDAGPLASGTYRPTNSGGDADQFPQPVPAPLGGARLSVFNGTDPNGTWSLYAVDDNGEVEGSLGGGWSLHITTDCERPMQVEYQDEFVNLDDLSRTRPGITGSTVHPSTASALHEYEKNNRTKVSNRMVRTVELIPRQGSLNVNDMNLRVKAGALNFVLSTLFGFGSRLSVQRQREQFSQFVQQELYSAAFGKGSREFGWTFTPMPGTDRLLSGVRTTYAVVVVPDDASSIVLESNGCYFPRSYYPPNDFTDTKSQRWNANDRTSRNCGGETTQAFVVPIPSARVEGGNEFWVEKIKFRPVDKGGRVVVSITGKNFSPQMGVLIDGVPLIQSIGLAQPAIRDDSAAGRAAAEGLRGEGVLGFIERVTTNKLIFSFKMPADYAGTPAITLIAPGRGTDINDLPNVDVNEVQNTTLNDYPKKMFGDAPAPAPFRIDKVKVFRSRTPGYLTAIITGAGFRAGNEPTGASSTVGQVLVNGAPPTSVLFASAGLMTAEFPLVSDESIKISLVSNNPNRKKIKTVESEAVANPAFLSVADVETVSYEPATEDEPTSTLVVRITGTGFSDKLTATFGGKTIDLAVKSATEALLAIPDPKAASVVTLRDTVTGQEVKIVATRKVQTPR
jgi:hypothetical protein